jgi:hypothetical protein
MTIELPKDVEGYEIPLDTTKLFGASGNAYNITRWIYTTDFDTSDSAAVQWRAATDTFERLDPELMHLTQPNSWEQLEKDLTAFGDGQIYGPCHYFHELGDDCTSCVARDDVCAVMRDVASRIRNLMGED